MCYVEQSLTGYVFEELSGTIDLIECKKERVKNVHENLCERIERLSKQVEETEDVMKKRKLEYDIAVESHSKKTDELKRLQDKRLRIEQEYAPFLKE